MESLAEALQVGLRELETLTSLKDRVTAGVAAVGDVTPDGLPGEFASMRSGLAQRLTDHLASQSSVLSTFNIAFFGRTGAGKSTLLSAFGELDGEAVSPGECDWTTEVGFIEWRGCRLYDTPGINGWGGRRNRDELEAAARKAVDIADVVLLCFDTQSQQASEFAKVADWVTHFGKPVIAVLNVRNLRWRHPARVKNQAARRNMSESVAQHAENVRTELANIGLNDVPVVAISSRRALFARSATPYRGPQELNFAEDRATYGIDYLERWSNFAALESVLSACITAGGAQLRLKSLREGVRALLDDEAMALEQLSSRTAVRMDELDRTIRRYLEVLGYVEGSKLITLAEKARGVPYATPVDGALVRHVRNLLKPHLAETLNKSLARFKELENEAFSEKKQIGPELFAGRVFRQGEITDALRRVSADAGNFLERELSLAGIEFRLRYAKFATTGLDGDAGDTTSFVADVLRGGGLAGGAAAVAAPFLFSNPLGWAAIAAGVGLGAAGSGLGWFGGDMSRAAAREKAEARAKAMRAGRKAIHDSFDAIERDFAADAYASAWDAAAPVFRPVLLEFIALAALRTDVDALIAELTGEASAIPQTAPFHLLDVTAQVMEQHHGAVGGSSRAEDFLLGEDWYDHEGIHQDIGIADDFAPTCRERHDKDAATLRNAVEEAFRYPPEAELADWTQLVDRAAVSDEAFAAVAAAAAARPRPAVAVAGDYSAGKSSFIKRMITEFGGEVPSSLHVRADATTQDVLRYPLGPVEIIDTPGFQSRRLGHDELGLAGAREAAMVIVLLHVNLLIGDTTALQKIARGTSTAAGKWPRMLFVINRCDELGVDPVDSIHEFFNRRDRKCAELAAALKAHDIPGDSAHIHGIAADPFGEVGAHVPVSVGDYDRNREWDGVAALVDALRAWAEADLGHASALVAFDAAVTQLLALREATRSGIAECENEMGKYDSLLESMKVCLEDADFLSQSLELELADTLFAPVNGALAKIRSIAEGAEKELAESVVSWRNPETQDAIERFMKSAAAKVNDWSAAHHSAISRAEAAAGFEAGLDLPGELSVDGGGNVIGRVAGAAGGVADVGGKLGKLLGNQKAVLEIGHFFGHKFKPWGAIKAGKAVGRAGVVLGVVAVAADAAAWANETRKLSEWESKRDAAVEEAESGSLEYQRKVIAEPGGPWRYLAGHADEVRERRGHFEDRQRSAEAAAQQLRQRLLVADALLDAAQDMRKATTGE